MGGGQMPPFGFLFFLTVYKSQVLEKGWAGNTKLGVVSLQMVFRAM